MALRSSHQDDGHIEHREVQGDPGERHALVFGVLMLGACGRSGQADRRDRGFMASLFSRLRRRLGARPPARQHYSWSGKKDASEECGHQAAHELSITDGHSH